MYSGLDLSVLDTMKTKEGDDSQTANNEVGDILIKVGIDYIVLLLTQTSLCWSDKKSIKNLCHLISPKQTKLQQMGAVEKYATVKSLHTL